MTHAWRPGLIRSFPLRLACARCGTALRCDRANEQADDCPGPPPPHRSYLAAARIERRRVLRKNALGG